MYNFYCCYGNNFSYFKKHISAYCMNYLNRSSKNYPQMRHLKFNLYALKDKYIWVKIKKN